MVVPPPDETEVPCDAYEHALGWGAIGETGGEWTGSPTYASSETTFTDSGADFQAYMVGWGREATPTSPTLARLAA